MKHRLLLLFFTLFATAVFAQPLRIFLIGDSTCADKTLEKQNPERGWGQLFQPLFDSCVVVCNHATNGRSTRSFRSEGRWRVVEEQLSAGDYVFIQFGHNDQKIKDSTRYSSPEQYAENLRRYVQQTRAKGAVPVLLTPIVRRHFTADGVLEDTHGAYPAAARRIAAEEGVALIDAEQLTYAWIAGLGDDASKPYFMCIDSGICPLYPDGRTDNTHLSVRGAHTVARMIADALTEAALALAAHRVSTPDFVVAKDGSGDFLTLSEAVTAIPDFCRDTTRIVICEGVYREKITIPATKRHVILSGRGAVTLTWNDYASKRGVTGAELGTSGSATVYFGGDYWMIRNLTFENSAGAVGQAVAVQCLATGLHFVGCRFLGNQDTLYLYGRGNCDGQRVVENARMWFDNCYIEGTTDFIFGSAMALFRGCEIRSKADSCITAASTCEGQPCGLVFDRCRLTADAAVTRCYLGRPWRNYAQTVFIDCDLGAHIRPEGWHDWNKKQAHKTTFYAESGSSGAGAAGRRVGWAKHLNPRTAQALCRLFEE